MMQQFKNCSRAQKLFMVCGVVFALICLFQIFVMDTFREPPDEVFDYGLIQYEDTVSLDQAEFHFSPRAQKVEAIAPVMAQKPADDSGRLVLEVLRGDTLIFRGSRPCSMYAVGDIVDFPVRLALDPDETYTARFTLIDTQAQDELLLCGTTGEGGEICPLVYVQCAGALSLVDKLLMTLYVCILLAIYLAIVFVWPQFTNAFMRKLKSAGRQVQILPAAILTGLGALMCLEYSGAELTVLSKLIMMALVFASSQWLLSDENKITTLKQSRHKLLYAALSLWAAFSVVGTKLFLEKLYLPVRPIAFITFLLTAALFLPVVIWVEAFLCDFSNRLFSSAADDETTLADGRVKRKKALTLAGFIILLTLVTFVFYLRAFNPAISSPDTVHCMYYAKNGIKGIDDWHPAFYILWLKAIVKICPTAEAVVFVQFVFFAYVMIRAMLFLQKRNIPEGLLYVVVVLTYLNVANMQHLMIIWKDIPYTLSILWLTVSLARIFFGAEDGEQQSDWFVYAELVVSLVWTCLFRHPGIVVFIIVATASVLYAKKNRRLPASIAIALALVVFIKGPVYSHYEIQADHGGGVYIGLGADIMGVYYNDGELSEAALNMVEQLTDHDMMKYMYMPRWSNASYNLQVGKADFIKAYLDTFLKNPLLMTKCILSRMGFVWDVFEQNIGDLGTINFTMTMDASPDWNTLWNKREVNFFTWKLQERLDESVNNRLLNTLEWRSGIYFLSALLALGALRLKKRLKAGIIVFLPLLAHVLSLLLSTGWSEFRYVLPIQSMAVFLVLFTLSVENKPEKIG